MMMLASLQVLDQQIVLFAHLLQLVIVLVEINVLISMETYVLLVEKVACILLDPKRKRSIWGCVRKSRSTSRRWNIVKKLNVVSAWSVFFRSPLRLNENLDCFQNVIIPSAYLASEIGGTAHQLLAWMSIMHWGPAQFVANYLILWFRVFFGTPQKRKNKKLLTATRQSSSKFLNLTILLFSQFGYHHKKLFFSPP